MGHLPEHHSFVDWVFKPLVLLYQMPKTGSQTVEATLRASGLGSLVRVHFLSTENTDHLRRVLSWKTATPEWKSQALEQLNFITRFSKALQLRKLLRRFRAPIPRLKVIAGVREVIGAALSAIFENHALFVAEPEMLTPEKCLELLRRPKLCAQFHTWFDVELIDQLGFNIYDHAFPTEQGYATYRNHLAEIMIYRFENFQSVKRGLESFLGSKLTDLESRNLGNDKPYARLYAKAKSGLSLPLDFARELESSRMMKHFYTEQERDEFTSKWARSPGISEEYTPQESTGSLSARI